MPHGPYYAAGRYWGKVVNQQLGESSTGKPQIVITFQVLGRVNAADPEGELLPCGENYERSVFRSITDKTIDWIMRDLEKLGFTGTSFKQLDLGSPNAYDLRGHELAFSCQHGTNQEGKPREEWSVSGEGNSVVVKPLEPKAVRDLDNLFGRQLKAMAAAAKKVDAPSDTPADVPAETPLPTAKKASKKVMEHPFPDPNAQPADAGADVPLEPPERPLREEVTPPAEGDIPF